MSPTLTATAAGEAVSVDYGPVKPTAATTGPRVALKPYAGQFGPITSGDLVLSAAGVSLVGLDIPARILVRAAGVTITDCHVHPSKVMGFGQNTAVIDCNHTAVQRCLLERNELHPDVPSPWWDAVIGHDYTARGNHSYWTADSYGVYNNNAGAQAGPTNVLIEGNYAHDLAFFGKGSDTSDGMTHNDHIQIQGGTGTVIRGNNLQGFLAASFPGYDPAVNDPSKFPRTNIAAPYFNVTTSCVQVTPNVSIVTGCLVEGNWLDGGAVGVNLATVKASLNPSGGVTNFGTIRSNRFGHKQGFPQGHVLDSETTWTVATSKTITATLTGNVYDDTGHLIATHSN